MLERAPNKHIRDIDFALIGIVLLISVISVVAVASASRVNLTGNPSYFLMRQVLWFLLGFVAMVLAIRYDYSDLEKYWKWLYAFGTGTLVLVDLLGSVTNGAKSWFQIGPIKYEPAELMKIILIISLATFLQNLPEQKLLRKLSSILLLAGIPISLVILQPDLGTSLMMTAIATSMIWAAGVKRAYLLALLAGSGMALGGLILMYRLKKSLFFTLIHPYQWERLTTFLHPDKGVSGASYQLNQSLLAIGGGQLWGEGIFRGIQTQGAWIPERHTDFIFSVVGEEWGFIGAGFLLLAYLFLLLRMIRIGLESRDEFGCLLTAGVISMFLAQIFENVGMTMSMMPITGITLPLMSYGGSSILSSMLAIGLVINVGYRRKKIRF